MDVNDQSDTAVASYSYDYLGRRISRTVYGSPDVTTKYCYNGDHVIAEYDGSNNLLRKFIYGPGIDEPVCMIDVDGGNVVYYYHLDGLGSVAALSDVNNVIVESYSYDVFGAPTIYDENQSEISQIAIGNPYMFTARRADDETALYYYRARYYAFDIGRFLQTDPIGYTGGLNLYAYCGNNPIVWIDPLGMVYELLNPGEACGGKVLKFPPPSRADYFITGVGVGAIGTAAVVVAAPVVASAGATALTTLSVSATTATTVSTGTVNVALVIGGGYGAVKTGLNMYDAAVAENWDAFYFDLGTIVGGTAMGISGGGRYLAEGLMGKPSPAPNTWNPVDLLGYELDNRYLFSLGPQGLKYFATSPTPISGGAVSTAISSGVGSSIPIGVDSSSGMDTSTREGRCKK